MGAFRLGAVVSLVLFLACPSLATPAEYRLRVTNIDDDAYFHFADRDGGDTATPFTLRRIEPALERDALPSGVFVTSRALLPDPGTARSFQAVEASPLGPSPRTGPWQEVRWEGKPGERAVWVVRGERVGVRQGVVKRTLWSQRYDREKFFTPGKFSRVELKDGKLVPAGVPRVPDDLRAMAAVFSNVGGKANPRVLAYIDPFRRLKIALDSEAEEDNLAVRHGGMAEGLGNRVQKDAAGKEQSRRAEMLARLLSGESEPLTYSSGEGTIPLKEVDHARGGWGYEARGRGARERRQAVGVLLP